MSFPTQFTSRLKKPIRLLFTIYLGLSIGTTGGLIYWSWRNTRQQITDHLIYSGQIMAQSTKATFKSFESLLIVLGQQLVKQGVDGNLEEGRELLERTNQLHTGMAGFALTQQDGQILLLSNFPPETPLPNLLDNPETAQDFRNTLTEPGLHIGRSYFMDALAQWIIPIRVGLSHTTDLDYVMSAGLTISGGDSPWQVTELPAEILFQVIRPDGYLQFQSPLASNVSFKQLYGQPLPPDAIAQLQAVEACNTTQVHCSKTLWNVLWQGEHRILNVTYLSTLKLYVVVSSPMAVFYQEWLTGVGVILFGLGIFVFLSWLAFRALASFQEQSQAEVVYYATHDVLTRLPNRWLLCDRLEQTLLNAQMQNQLVGIFLVDLDHFKRVNDSYGHEFGDALLKQVAARLQELNHLFSTISRQGGDEFILVSIGVQDIRDLESAAEQILAIFKSSFVIENHVLNLSPSIGIAVFPTDANTAIELIQSADTTLYRAKERQRGSYLFFDVAMNQEAQRRLMIESELRKALEHHEFTVHYQPQIDIFNHTIRGCEALVRWHNPTLGQVSPAEFIPIAEDIGLIVEIGKFVLEQACQDIYGLRDRYKAQYDWDLDLSLSVNFSAKQLKRRDVLQELKHSLETCKIPHDKLVIEITESIFVDDFPTVAELLRAIRQLGIGIAIDDFGTGYSSLSYLSRLPISELKIDQSFVRDLLTDSYDANLTRSIVALGLSLEMDVIAEGTETHEQLQLLKTYGCRYAQGYYISQPLPIDQLEIFLQNLEWRSLIRQTI